MIIQMECPIHVRIDKVRHYPFCILRGRRSKYLIYYFSAPSNPLEEGFDFANITDTRKLIGLQRSLGTAVLLPLDKTQNLSVTKITDTSVRYSFVLFDFLVTVKAEPHECVIRTCLP